MAAKKTNNLFEAMDFDFGFNIDEKTKEEEDPEINEDDLVTTITTSVQVKRMKQRHYARRVTSELNLEKQLDWHMEDGCSYHCISHGDVDSLTYLRMIVKQQKLKYLLVSTWCMAITDVDEIRWWIERGYIERVDFYVGEIFQNSYYDIYEYIKDNVIRNDGRIAVFRNHSKVMVGYGERFDFVIESSANINTNPRTEQTNITLNRNLANFYKEFYDGITSFNRDFDNWEIWQHKLPEEKEGENETI